MPATPVDRAARDRLAAETRRFLNDETKSFEFDEAVLDRSSEDETVWQVALELWCFYDDLDDHHVRLTKEEWNYVQRLLLILESDDHLVVKLGPRIWKLSHLMAAGTFISFLVTAAYAMMQNGWQSYLLP